MPREVRTRWLATVDETLGTTPQAVAIVPIDDLLGDDSYLSALKARGYTIESPDDE